MRTPGLLALSTAMLLSIAPAATATTVLSVTVETLAQQSDVVAVVTARSARSFWHEGHIVTDTALEVTHAMRGNVTVRSLLALRTPGGAVGRIGQRVPGVAALTSGRTYVVFLSRAPDDASLYYLTHLTASVLSVASQADGSVTVSPAVEGMTVGPASGPLSGRTVMTRAGVALDRLASTIR